MCVKDFLWQSQLQEFWGLIPEVLKKPWCCCCLCWVMTDPAQTSFARLNFSTSKLRIAFPPCHQRSLVWNKAGWRNTTSGKHSKTHMTITPHLAPAGRHSSCPNAPTFSVSAQGSFTDTLAHVLFHICCRAVVPMLGVIPQHWHMAWQYHWHTYTLESWKSQKKDTNVAKSLVFAPFWNNKETCPSSKPSWECQAWKSSSTPTQRDTEVATQDDFTPRAASSG